MRITKQTLESLQNEGIIAKIYPTDYETFYKKCYERRYNWLGMWYTDDTEHNIGCLPSNHPKRAEEAKQYALKDVNDWYNADVLYIEYDGRLITKKENVKSKEITADYVRKLVEKDKKAYTGAYGHFATLMQRVADKKGWRNSFNIYPTTYGIGVWVFYNWHAQENADMVAKFLKDYGVEFYNEYSLAHWVFRFKISKKGDNLERIERAVEAA